MSLSSHRQSQPAPVLELHPPVAHVAGAKIIQPVFFLPCIPALHQTVTYRNSASDSPWARPEAEGCWS